jgi:glucose-1-phosphate cytidylyltransferase
MDLQVLLGRVRLVTDGVKVAILAGGKGKRLEELTRFRPKPLVRIGGRPIIWHIMKHYSHYGYKDFAIALGYGAGAMIRWFHGNGHNGWHVDLLRTGLRTETGGRIKRLEPYVGDGTFMLTWCDGLSDLNLSSLLEFHQRHGKLATVTAVRPPPRFGHLTLKGDRVINFVEKPPVTNEWINGAFFVLEPGVFEYLDGDRSEWEREPLESLARDGELMAYRHNGFWQCMDTIYERNYLNRLWHQGTAPWAVWRS